MANAKLPYRKPALVRFGTIRSLTGGSGTVGRDGAISNSRNTPGGGG